MVRVFGGVFVGAFASFAGAFLFGAMARRRGFFGLEAGWEMERRGGRNERRRGRGFGGDHVYFEDLWMTGGSTFKIFSLARHRRARLAPLEKGRHGDCRRFC
jgi:hypothetical protein